MTERGAVGRKDARDGVGAAVTPCGAPADFAAARIWVPGSYIMFAMKNHEQDRNQLAVSDGIVPCGDDAHATRTLSVTLSYDGAPFNGFARQPGQLTVQGELESALRTVFRRDVEITCAGRTDAGVHALGQVISFDVGEDELRDRTSRSLCRSLNALTHDGIVVRRVEERACGFSARFDAVSREYRYRICVDETPPVFTRGFTWHISAPLDVAAMEEGARHLIGEHDFKSFCMAASAVGKPTHRYVDEISFSRETVMGENLLVVKIVGNAFLHSMVRTIIGTLVTVGKGRRDAAWVASVLEARDRSAAGENAPAAGLTLWGVDYDGPRMFEP